MDFTGKAIIKSYYDLDPETNILTITFKDEYDAVIDTLVIENIRYKALMSSLQVIASERITSLMDQLTPRTIYKAHLNMGDTSFL